MIRQEKRQARKYGMRRHFYDYLQLDESELPKESFRMGLNAADLEPYSDQIKQAFSLDNASDHEIKQAKYHRLITE